MNPCNTLDLLNTCPILYLASSERLVEDFLSDRDLSGQQGLPNRANVDLKERREETDAAVIIRD